MLTLIDSREPVSLHELGTVQLLPTGDAWLMCDDAVVIVERKTLSDLCSSIADGRFFNQVAEMREASDWCYVVVVGIPSVSAGKLVIGGKVSNWRWSSVQGSLLTAAEMGVLPVYCDGDTNYGQTLTWLRGRDREDVTIRERRHGVMETPAETILRAIPGIGSTRATALLKAAGTAAWALDWLTGDYGKELDIPGVGESTKAAARHALGLEENNKLEVTGEKKHE